MKISVAQIKPIKGNIPENIKIHKTWIEVAISEQADFIGFPELSLTGYEPKLANGLAMDLHDSRLDAFQDISDQGGIVIGLGAPTKSEHGIQISLILFQPNQDRKLYAKQFLHSDELPYFVQGQDQLILTVKAVQVAPAICYESLLPKHSEQAKQCGADLYLASVAKSQRDIEAAFAHFSKTAKIHSMPVLMSNSIGFCDNFQSAGQSAIWDSKGRLLDKLESNSEGLLIYDTETGDVIKREFNNDLGRNRSQPPYIG